jgi:hypothetical protein
VTSREWALILVLAAVVGFLVLLGLLMLLDWLGLFGRNDWD